jgi:hypothetical protein
MKSFRSLALLVSLLVVTALLAGCGQKAQNTAGTASSDSLLASNPVEQPQGQIEPQSGMQPAPENNAPAEAPKTEAPPAKKTPAPKTTPKPAEAPSVMVPAGTAIKVTMGTALTSETAKPGDAWTGTISEAVTIGSAAPFPAGSVVHGIVAGAKGAEKGDRAVLVLEVTSIEANGTSHEIGAMADSLVAGSTRKRNVGAIAGGAAAGALLGKAIGGSNKGAVIGGILGGAAATGAVAGSKGFQVEVAEGKAMVFTVGRDTKIKL